MFQPSHKRDRLEILHQRRVYVWPSPFTPLTGDVVSISAATLTGGLNPILLRVTAETSSLNYPGLQCEVVDTLAFDWFEAPVIVEEDLILPDYLCPGSEYELDAGAITENGTQDQLCFLWTECEEDSLLNWTITGDPCVNGECGVAQEGVG